MATMKALENVLVQIDRIRHIAARWSAELSVPDMERELLLDKLRALYEEVLFLDREPEDEHAEVAPEAPLAAEQTVKGDITVESDSGIRLDTTVPASEPEAIPAPEAEAEPEPAPGEFEPETGAVGQAEPEAVVWAQQTVSAVSETTDQKLFSDEAHVRTRVDKQVILSLYGEGAPAASARPLTGAYQPAAQPEPHSCEPEIGEEPETVAPAAARRETHVPAPLQNGHGPKVLGEIIASPGESLGERLGKQNSHADVASRLRASTITDLKHSIGINDRFLLINELFGGDSALYDQVLSRLNEFTALDDAMIYIQENFDWNPDGEGTLFLVELLERKLEN